MQVAGGGKQYRPGSSGPPILSSKGSSARPWTTTRACLPFGSLHDPTVFVEEILPLIQPLSTLFLARVTGLSRTHCQAVRAGKHVPHPRHWESFRAATGSSSANWSGVDEGGD